MSRLREIIRDQSGLATLVLAPFLLVSIIIVVSAWVVVTQVASTQRQVQAALAYTLRVAAIQGVTVLPNGAFLIDPVAPQAAAVQAVPIALPVFESSLTATGATYTPFKHVAPSTWGTVTLSGFTTGNQSQAAGGAPCTGGSAQSTPCAFVQATLSVPYTIDLFGVPIHVVYADTQTQALNTMGGGQFGS